MDHTLVHFEIPADDPERAARFYRELFGWQVEKWEGGGAGGLPEYWMVMTVPADEQGRPTRAGVNGGMMRRQQPDQAPVNYVGVENVDEYVKKAERLGGQLVVPKQAVSTMGWFAWLKDPEGNVFGVWETNVAG
ncbi:MAG: VOC family protein [Gemmatimonadota bacterium]